MISVVMPIACSDPQLLIVVKSLFRENRDFFKKIQSELIVVDSIPNSGHENGLEAIRKFADEIDCPISIDYLETSKVGVGLKFWEGLKVARGEHVFFMVDEVISLYDFLSDAYEVVSKWDVCSVPYLESRAPEDGSYPLRYSRYVPVAPTTFPLMRKEIFSELMIDMPSHWFSSIHWSLCCAAFGYQVAYASRHLNYCPLIKTDTSDRPPSYRPIGHDLYLENKGKFRSTWPVEKCEAAHRKMTHSLVSALEKRSSESYIVKPPRAGAYLVHQTCSMPVKSVYQRLTSPKDVFYESTHSVNEWADSRINDPKVRDFFDISSNTEVVSSVSTTWTRINSVKNKVLRVLRGLLHLKG